MVKICLCALGLPGKTIVSLVGQTSGLTNQIVTRLSEGRADGPMSQPQGAYLERKQYLGLRKVPQQRCNRIMNHPWEGLGTFLHHNTYRSTFL